MQKSDLSIIIPLFSVTIVSILGFLFNLIIIRLNQKQNISVKIVEQYFKIREDMCGELSKLANLKVINDLDQDLASIKNKISYMFYHNFDFLPKEVLHELLCLYACLSDEKNNLYGYDTINKDFYVIGPSQIEPFIENTSMIKKSKYYIYAQLMSDKSEIKRATSINLQARKVLDTMNEFFTLKNLLTWVKHLPKQ